MKHVFVIGSHTPYLTALGVIKEKGIKKEDVVFVLGRNYHCYNADGMIVSYDITPLYYIYLKGNTRAGIKKRIAELDNFINCHIAETYVLYIPHLMFFTFQIFATHSLCADVKFIQESVVDYCKPENSKHYPSLKDFYLNIFYFRGMRIWAANYWNSYRKIHKAKISETFANTDEIFKDMNCKHTIVKWPSMDVPVKLEDDAVCFVFESAVERKDIERDVYLNATKMMIRKFAKTHNYVKFHPYQTEENKREIMQMFENDTLCVKELPSEVPFEMILCSKEKICVVGFTTSLIYYAALMGHDAHICAPVLMASKKFRRYWKTYSKQLRCYDNFNYETSL